MSERQQNLGKGPVKGLPLTVSDAVEPAKMLYMRLTMSPRDFELVLAKKDITKAVSDGRVSRDDIDFLYKLANGADPTGSGLDNEGLIELTKKKGTELFGPRAGRFFWNGRMEVWDHMSSEYRRQSVNKPKT